MNPFAFIDAHRVEFRITVMCAILGVSSSGYYAWRDRAPSARQLEDARLSEAIKAIFADSHQTHGSPRVHAELRDRQETCGKDRVARLMRQLGLRARGKGKKRVRTTDSRHNLPVAPNRLDRDFSATRPNEKWTTDITYIRTNEGWLYLATVMDLFSRQVVGWSMRADMSRQLVIDALKMALNERRPPPGLLHHSDRGSQYCSHDYQRLLAQYDRGASMSRKGDCYDNAPMESSLAMLKSDRVDHRRFRTQAEARQDIFAYSASFYNRKRRHSSLSYMSPVAFEKSYELWLNGVVH